MYSNLPTDGRPFPAYASPMALPMLGAAVRAGFPSPAADFTVSRIDLTRELIFHPQCTFYLIVRGDSMIGIGIFDGDILVVDKYLRPQHGDIVVAEIDGEFTVKRLHHRNGVMKLCAENPTYPDIRPKDGQTLEIWGVVTSSIRRFRRA